MAEKLRQLQYQYTCKAYYISKIKNTLFDIDIKLYKMFLLQGIKTRSSLLPTFLPMAKSIINKIVYFIL